MNVAIISMGSQGDVQPYLALGAALRGAGHAVRLVTHENFGAAARANDLDFWPVRGNVQEVAQSPEMRDLLEKGNFLKINQYTAKLARTLAVDWAQNALKATKDVQLLIAGIGGLFLAHALSEKLGVPLIESYVVPFTPTREFPHPLVPTNAPKLVGLANRLTYHAVQQVMWQSSRAGDRLARRQILGLPAAPFFGPRRRNKWKEWPEPPVLYGVSSSVIPKPADWDAHVHVTGYWFLEPQTNWQPPASLQDFLQTGSPPVYIGFGSMSNRDPEETTDLVLEALKRTGQRAVLLKGWSGLTHEAPPDNVYLSGAVPHSWLFSRTAAVIHHGGAGTTAAGLRAGVPSVIIPFFGDQPFWGRRVKELGVGPAPMPRKTLTAEGLAQAIQTAVTDGEMRRKAARLGAAIREENGLQNAVSIIEAYGKRANLKGP